MIELTKAEMEKYLSVTGKNGAPIIRNRNGDAYVIIEGIVFWIYDYDYVTTTDNHA